MHPRKWTVNEVASFIESIDLADHAQSFKEGSVDGALFLQLTPEVSPSPSALLATRCVG